MIENPSQYESKVKEELNEANPDKTKAAYKSQEQLMKNLMVYV